MARKASRESAITPHEPTEATMLLGGTMSETYHNLKEKKTISCNNNKLMHQPSVGKLLCKRVISIINVTFSFYFAVAQKKSPGRETYGKYKLQMWRDS